MIQTEEVSLVGGVVSSEVTTGLVWLDWVRLLGLPMGDINMLTEIRYSNIYLGIDKIFICPDNTNQHYNEEIVWLREGGE